MDNIDHICRTCSNKTNSYTSIFNVLNYEKQLCKISSIIMACAPIEISENDGLSSIICENCLKLLHISFMFRIGVIQADRKFKRLQSKIQSTEPYEAVSGHKAPTMIEDNNFKTFISNLQSNEIDPLVSNPCIVLKSEVETEHLNETQPIEAVLIPTNLPLMTTESDESLCNISTLTSTESTAQNNIFEHQQLNIIPSEMQTINTNPFNSPKTDTVLENLFQNEQLKNIPPGSIILIQHDQSNNMYSQIPQEQNVVNNINETNEIHTNTLYEQYENKSNNDIKNASNNCIKNAIPQSGFEEELKKFVIEREKKCICNDNPFYLQTDQSKKSKGKRKKNLYIESPGNDPELSNKKNKRNSITFDKIEQDEPISIIIDD